jgi:hypothetical protein
MKENFDQQITLYNTSLSTGNSVHVVGVNGDIFAPASYLPKNSYFLVFTH